MTSGPIAISSPTSPPPLITIDSAGSTDTGAFILQYDPSALDPNAAPFCLNVETHAGINEPASSRNDTVFTLGYNIAPGGSSVDSSEPVLALHWENWYNQAGTDPNAAVEWFLEFRTAAGAAHRPFAAFMHRDGGFGEMSWTGSVFNLYDWSTAQRVKYDFSGSTSLMLFTQPASILFDANNVPALLQHNAARTSFVSLIELDYTDTITLSTKAQVFGALATSGPITAPAFMPNSGTTPGYGMYAPSNELGFAVAGTQVAHFDTVGRFWNLGARADRSYSKQVPVTGFSITISDACGRLILDPAGTLATGTITMPAHPIDGQICKIASCDMITALTHLPSTGQTLNGALTTIATNGFAEYTYSTASASWYRTG